MFAHYDKIISLVSIIHFSKGYYLHLSSEVESVSCHFKNVSSCADINYVFFY
jgi:hypothetical protein